MSLIKGMENLLGNTMKFFTWANDKVSIFSLYLFCNGLLYNLVKTGQVENVADSTQLVVNFRSLEFKLFQATFRFVSRIPSRSRLEPHRPRVSG